MLTDHLERARRQLGRVDNIDLLLVSFEEPPAEARSWAEENGIDVIVNRNCRPGTLYIVNPAALGDLVRH